MCNQRKFQFSQHIVDDARDWGQEFQFGETASSPLRAGEGAGNRPHCTMTTLELHISKLLSLNFKFSDGKEQQTAAETNESLQEHKSACSSVKAFVSEGVGWVLVYSQT